MEILGIILGFIGTIMGTISGTVFVSKRLRKANAEKAEQEAEKVKQEAIAASIENERASAQVIQQYIVLPLKEEIEALRKAVQKFHKAIKQISYCKYEKECPVRAELEKKGE